MAYVTVAFATSDRKSQKRKQNLSQSFINETKEVKDWSYAFVLENVSFDIYIKKWSLRGVINTNCQDTTTENVIYKTEMSREMGDYLN